jgi:adenosylcobyric acid synthase
MSAPTLMVQGTASSVGKSLLATALCRYFRREGLRVAPFKAQNMALNSAVTPDGLEIGRAQAVQAEAAGIAASVDMNPILLKPEGDARSQVVVMGKSIGSMNAIDYHEHKPALRRVVADALERLRASHDLVIIEGAGSPAEINLKHRDLVNMYVAKLVQSPVLLAGDIDKGGVFAAFVGTMELLDPEERALVAAFVVNKFRGDAKLLEPGLRFLSERTGRPVLGVVPHVPNLRIADEDSVSLDARMQRGRASRDEIEIAVIRLPRISNYDDFEPFEHEPGVVLRFVDSPREFAGADLVILPGSKSTVSDLDWLRDSGIAPALMARAARGEPILGVCGGCQMLGERIEDPRGVESSRRVVTGLGLLPLRTEFEPDKLTATVQARSAGRSLLCADAGQRVRGYEIHMGRVERTRGAAPLFELETRSDQPVRAGDGAASDEGHVLGTMLHGLFENDGLRRDLLRALGERRGFPADERGPLPTRQAEYDRLEAAFRGAVSRDLLLRIARLG